MKTSKFKQYKYDFEIKAGYTTLSVHNLIAFVRDFKTSQFERLKLDNSPIRLIYVCENNKLGGKLAGIRIIVCPPKVNSVNQIGEGVLWLEKVDLTVP